MHDLYFYSTDLFFFSKVGSGLELHTPRQCVWQICCSGFCERVDLERADGAEKCSLSVAQKRDVIERVFGLQLRAQIQAVRPGWLMYRDDARFVRHVDNHRQNRVRYANMQQPKDGYRPQQLRLLDARSKEDMERVIAQRRLEIITCLSPNYMRVRVAVIRTWVHFWYLSIVTLCATATRRIAE